MIRYLVAAALIILAGYGFKEAWPLLAGPSLSIVSPIQNAAYPGGIVSVLGKAPRAATLLLNGAPLLHGPDGSFSSALTLARGGSILTFTAVDRFGRSVTATRTVFVPTTDQPDTNN